MSADLFYASACSESCVIILSCSRRPASAGCSASGATGSDNAADCSALLAAYSAWGNQPSGWGAAIAAGSSYCSWIDASNIMIQCTGARVTSLTVYTNAGLVGSTIPPSLGGLAALTALTFESSGGLQPWLQRAGLTGTIPSSLGSLRSLQSLIITEQSIAGTIPDTISSLSSLTDLFVVETNLNGTLPAWLGSLSSLTILCVSLVYFISK